MAKLDIQKLATSPNIVEELDEDQVGTILQKCISGYDTDYASMGEKWDQMRQAIQLAKLIPEHLIKTDPFPNASNAVIPLISTAAIQFIMRAVPEITRNGKVVMFKTQGHDPQGIFDHQATNAAKYMNYQLLDQSDEWIQSTIKVLTTSSICGMGYKKTYFDPIKGRISFKACKYDSIVINNDIETLENALRISHTFYMSKNDIKSYQNAGFFCDYDDEELFNDIDEDKGQQIEIIEQHRTLDLDEDGYAEPYIVTFSKDKKKILRINARFNINDIKYNDDDEILMIEPIEYFTDYGFLTSPDGGFQKMGFGTLLLHINNVVNSLTNILVDSGKMSSLQAGLVSKGLMLKQGVNSLKPGELREVNTPLTGGRLSDNLMLFDFKDPSNVLFEMLQFLVNHANKLVSVTDAVTGQNDPQYAKTGAANLAIDQGLKVFNGIMTNIYMALKKEFKKIYRLNGLFIDPQEYQNFINEPIQTLQDGSISDFNSSNIHITPIADPNSSNDQKRAQWAQSLMQLTAAQSQFSSLIDPSVALEKILEAIDMPSIQTLIKQQTPKTDPNMMQIKADATHKAAELEQEDKKLHLQALTAQQDFSIKKELADAQAILYRAQATAALSQIQNEARFKQLEMQTESLLQHQQSQADLHQEQLKQAGGIIKERIKGEHSTNRELVKAANNLQMQKLANENEDANQDTDDESTEPGGSDTSGTSENL